MITLTRTYVYTSGTLWLLKTRSLFVITQSKVNWFSQFFAVRFLSKYVYCVHPPHKFLTHLKRVLVKFEYSKLPPNLHCSVTTLNLTKQNLTRMWANAQRDGRPAEYRWRPLFNAAKFGWRPLLECRAVTLPITQNPLKFAGCPKLLNRSQPLVGRSSPYYENMWRRYCCLVFSDCRYVP